VARRAIIDKVSGVKKMPPCEQWCSDEGGSE
jgi:hypothetical protein